MDARKRSCLLWRHQSRSCGRRYIGEACVTLSLDIFTADGYQNGPVRATTWQKSGAQENTSRSWVGPWYRPTLLQSCRVRRQSEEVKLKERARDCSARQAARSNEEVRRSEQSSNTHRRKAAQKCSTLDELVTHFRHSISTGPVFICSSCDQLLYKHSVQKACSLRSASLPVVHSVLLNHQFRWQRVCMYVWGNWTVRLQGEGTLTLVLFGTTSCHGNILPVMTF